MSEPICPVNMLEFPTANHNNDIKIIPQRRIFAKALREGH